MNSFFCVRNLKLFVNREIVFDLYFLTICYAVFVAWQLCLGLTSFRFIHVLSYCKKLEYGCGRAGVLWVAFSELFSS